jgi:16S rRNA (cytidine1402-2'-O)-methyltransferase
VSQDVQVSAGVLYICGTPIGNLKDVTYRLIEVLEHVDVVVCEDTRRTLKLLSHFGIAKKVISVHQHVERERTSNVCDLLSQGKSVAFVSDAGMPVVSDPGAYLVRTARERGYKIQLVPGPSSVSGALALSGFSGDKFVFGGFLPRKPKDRREFFRRWVWPGIAAVFFESPYRVKKSLKDLAEVFPACQISLCHEMTKIHESVIWGRVGAVLADLEGEALQGEWVIVVFLPPDEDARHSAEETNREMDRLPPSP